MQANAKPSISKNVNKASIVYCAGCGLSGKAAKSFQRCSRCASVSYCCRSCQQNDWKQHKKICKMVNAGDAQQLTHADHAKNSSANVFLDTSLSNLAASPLPAQKAWKIFLSEDTSSENISEMKCLLGGLSSINKEKVMIVFVGALLHVPGHMLKLETSPLLIMLSMNEVELSKGYTPLHVLVGQAAADNVQTHYNQKRLAKQLIKAGANVNAEMDGTKCTPLHIACDSCRVTNLELIKLLLDHGANPNAQLYPSGHTVLMSTIKFAMPAAKFLLTYTNTNVVPINVNIKCTNGATFRGTIRGCIAYEKSHHQQPAEEPSFAARKKQTKREREQLLQQFLEVEAILVEMGAIVEDGDTLILDDDTIILPSGLVVVTQALPATTTRTMAAQNLLPFDIGVLLVEDDLFKNGPQWYLANRFFINDSLALHSELMGKGPHLHSGCMEGTSYSDQTKPPAVGQVLEVTASFPREVSGETTLQMARLTGTITEVFANPTEKQLRGSNSYLYKKKCNCGDPTCGITRTGSYKEILEKYGSVNGQKVKGIVSLKQLSSPSPEAEYFFRGYETKFEVILRCNDGLDNMWQIVRIRIATAEPSSV